MDEKNSFALAKRRMVSDRSTRESIWLIMTKWQPTKLTQTIRLLPVPNLFYSIYVSLSLSRAIW